MMIMGCSTGTTISIRLFLLLLASLCLETIKLSWCDGDVGVSCIEKERKALLRFKESLTDPSGRLSSWSDEDCCSWTGIVCSNRTGRVIKLNLRNPFQFGKSDVIDSEDPAYVRSSLGGELNSSLLDLKHLNYLDLSMNNFKGIPIPNFIGSLEKLRYLNLSGACFNGKIPPRLGNLSSLCYLDLFPRSYLSYPPELVLRDLYFDSYPRFWFPSKLVVDNLHWLSGLSSLKILNLGFVNLGEATDWLQIVNTLPSLSELYLLNCNLSNLPFSLPFVNFTSLTVLDLSHNHFDSSIPQWIFNISSLAHLRLNSNQFRGLVPVAFANMTSLQELNIAYNLHLEGGIPSIMGKLCKLTRLDLGNNKLTGEITGFVEGLSRCSGNGLEFLRLESNDLSGHLPESMGHLKNLRSLLLSYNSFSGSLPTSIGSLSSLRVLNLYYNKMNGTIPKSIGQLSELEDLDMSFNAWRGVVSEDHFANVSRLKYLGAGTNSSGSLVLDVSLDWVPSFQLKQIDFRNCKLGHLFPAWLRTQKEFTLLYLSNVGIVDTIPDWFWEQSSKTIATLDLSNNQIYGELPKSLTFVQLGLVDLSSNRLGGPLPLWSSNLSTLNFANNFFSGAIPSNISKTMPALFELDLSNNSLNGSIPSSLCELKILAQLSLEKNHLSGELPSCWKNLQVLNLAGNNLSGQIPSSIGSVYSLKALLLNNNNFYGELPSSLKNCTELVVIDLGENRFSGKIPTWIGQSSSSLSILRLRGNLFSDRIPPQLCHLNSLQILDLGHNNLSGSIPRCVGNLSAMVVTGRTTRPYLKYLGPFPFAYDVNMVIVSKGRELEYGSTLSLVTSIDLSSNSLSGWIPEELTGLSGLLILNLSENHLMGKIPDKIGSMRWLVSLDLSRNELSGVIPPGMSALNFLSYLNLSYNKLSGKIPSGNQLQTLNDPSIYKGNPKLCGPPVTETCPGDHETSQGPAVSFGGDEDGFEIPWFYICMGTGFAVGFWVVCGVLIVKKSWRYAYFQFLDDTKDRIFVTVAVYVARLQSRMELERN